MSENTYGEVSHVCQAGSDDKDVEEGETVPRQPEVKYQLVEKVL